MEFQGVFGFRQHTQDLQVRRRERMGATQRLQRVGFATQAVQRHARQCPGAGMVRLQSGRLQEFGGGSLRIARRASGLAQFDAQLRIARRQRDCAAHALHRRLHVPHGLCDGGVRAVQCRVAAPCVQQRLQPAFGFVRLSALQARVNVCQRIHAELQVRGRVTPV